MVVGMRVWVFINLVFALLAGAFAHDSDAGQSLSSMEPQVGVHQPLKSDLSRHGHGSLLSHCLVGCIMQPTENITQTILLQKEIDFEAADRTLTSAFVDPLRRPPRFS